MHARRMHACPRLGLAKPVLANALSAEPTEPPDLSQSASGAARDPIAMHQSCLVWLASVPQHGVIHDCCTAAPGRRSCAASRHALMFGWLMNPGRGWRDALSLEPSRAPV